jgi:LysR family nitrogen assimilation transcriptional regulator
MRNLSIQLCQREHPPRMTTTPTLKLSGISLEIFADLHKWSVFVAVAEMASITRAALQLGMDQSVVSRRINALERECNARLFNRTGRGVQLSEIGQRILPQVNGLLAEAREPAGDVTLGLLPSTTHPLIRLLFTRLRANHPKVHLHILEGSSGQIDEWLSSGRVDIAILYRYGAESPGLEQALAYVDSYLIGSATDRLTARAEVPFKALNGLPFILPGAPNGLRVALDTLARKERIAVVPVMEADSLPLMKSIAEHGEAYTVLPLHAVWNEVADGRLRASRIVGPRMQRIISMGQAQNKGPGRTVTVVTEAIVDIVKTLAEDGMWRTGSVSSEEQ